MVGKLLRTGVVALAIVLLSGCSQPVGNPPNPNAADRPAFDGVSLAGNTAPTTCAVDTEAEAEARAANRGLWGDPESVAPWEWRRQKRK